MNNKTSDEEPVIVSSKNEDKENREGSNDLREEIIIAPSEESSVTETRDNLSMVTHGEELVISSASDSIIDPILAIYICRELLGDC